MHISKIITTIYPLSDAALHKIILLLEPVIFKKGTLIITENTFVNCIYIIESGLTRAFTNLKNDQITFWFGYENDIIVGMKSYVEGALCYENIEALEEVMAYKIDHEKLKSLFETDLEIANWGRHFAEIELLKTEKRLMARQVKTATERYLDLGNKHPEILKRVPLGYIASYLGITQVSLSRIRAELK